MLKRLISSRNRAFASIDVSFISLSLILPALHRVLTNQGQVVALVKPQFEAGREQIGKNGIIRDDQGPSTCP